MKNFSIITLILIIPLVMYFTLTKSDISSTSNAAGTSKPQIIKFTSLMCLDCKKLGEVFKDVYPKYSNKITLTEIKVQDENGYTKKQIEKYNVTLVPTMIFINSKGQQVKRLEGFVDKAQLEQYMRDLK